MQVKGTAVKSIQQYVKKFYGDRYNEWISELSPQSKDILSQIIVISEWYPVLEALLEPTVAVGKLFFNGDSIKAATETGRYSADMALTGAYKIFTKVAPAKFFFQRAAKILSVYYEPSEVVMKEIGSKHIIISMNVLPLHDVVLETRMWAWVMRGLEITGCKNVKVDVTLSHARGDAITEMVFTWD
jgi:hypothetical protein